MKTKILLSALVLSGVALAQPAQWNTAQMGNASYLILEPRIEGNANVISAEQRAGVLSAMKRDLAGAIKRRYPNAQIVTDAQTPNVIKAAPILTAPDSLMPWSTLNARVDFEFTDGQKVQLGQNFSVLTLWQHSYDAANYLFDQLVTKLP